MRACLFALLCWPLLLSAAELRYPEHFFPGQGSAGPDLRLELQGGADGAVTAMRVLESKQPGQDAAAIEALRGWHFRPDRRDGEPVAWTRSVGFSFRELAEPDTPAQIDDEWTFFYPQGKGWSGADPEVLLDLVIAADGEVRSARVLEAADPELAQAALKLALRRGHAFRPALRDGKPVLSRLRWPLVFTTLPRAELQPRAEYPQELLLSGNEGDVLTRFTVAQDGSLRDIRVLESAHPAFTRSALAAMRHWRFVPAQRGGKPQAVVVTQALNFRFVGRQAVGTTQPGRPYALSRREEFSDGLPEEFRYDQAPEVRLANDVPYPLELLRKGEQGTATINLVVRPDGKVEEAAVIKATHPAFGLAAKAAMETWEFVPARKDGKPGWALLSREYEFRMAGSGAPGRSAQRLLRGLDPAPPGLDALDAPPVPVHQPPAAYPLEQRQAGVAETVLVEFFIDRDGQAQLPAAVEYRDEALAWAAVTAVSRWSFEPPLKDGKPTDVRARVPVIFELERGGSP